MSAAQQQTDQSTVAHARYVGDAILYIDTRGAWYVGLAGQKVSEYQPVTLNGRAGITDDTYEVTALAVEARSGGGFTLYAVSNDNPDLFYAVTLDARGAVTGASALDVQALFEAEVRLGTDLNFNGGIGAAPVLVDGSRAKLYLDGLGRYQIEQADGRLVDLKLDGQVLRWYDLADFEIEAVVPQANGAYRLYVRDEAGTVFEVDADAGGGARASSVRVLGSAQVAEAEQSLGLDLNGRPDTPASAGWTASIQTPGVRAAVEQLSAGGQKIGHAGLVQVWQAAVQAAEGNGGKVGAALLADLQALAARGEALLTAPDLAGRETGYLSSVWDQLVNGSKANLHYTGGAERAQSLGNLSADASAQTLRLLGQKWLLGADLPAPTTQGDTANPNARAATGTYKAFDAPLLAGGVQAFDVNQGSAGTCYLLASVASLAQVRPDVFNGVFVSNGPGPDGQPTWGVRFYDTAGKAHWVTVNNQLVVRNPSDTEPAYAKAKGVDAQGQVTAELWVPLLEKAYAQANELGIFKRDAAVNSMAAIEGGLAEPIVFLGGGAVTAFDQEVMTVNGNPVLRTRVLPEGSSVLQELTRVVNSGKPILVGSSANTQDPSGATLWTSGHAYTLWDADPGNPSNTTVKVYNPWGFSVPTAQNPTPMHLAPFDADLVQLVGMTELSFWFAT